MKLTILIMTLFLIQVSAKTSAQITIREKNTTLQKVMRAISSQSGYDFVYSNTDFKDLKPVSITLTNATVEEALKTAFSGQPLVYEVSEKTVMVKRKEEKEESFIDKLVTYFNSSDVRGRVVDEKYLPISGATVRVKGGTQTSVTNERGEFLLKKVDENAILIITYVGYKEKQIRLTDDLINIKLEESTSQLDQVQVQAYGLTSRRLSTGSITTIKSVDIEKQPINNPLYALQGRVPGLIVTPASGLPGAAVTLQIRGQNSFVGALTQPLILIDGVPYANNTAGPTSFNNDGTLSSLHFINPSDIESIDILKDADATAIYGSRGANGVILITTKKGKAGNVTFNISAQTGVQMRSNPELKLLNTPQYLAMRKEAYVNDGLQIPTTPEPSNYDLTVWDPNRYTNWQEVLGGGHGSFTTAQASISGGTDLIQYRLDGTYNGSTSIFPGHAGDHSGTGHFSLTGITPNQKLKTTLTASYTVNSSKTPDFTSTALFLPPNAPTLYKPNGELNWEPNPLSGMATWQNPLASLNNVSTASTNVITASADVSYRFSDKFQLKTTAGFNKTQTDGYGPMTLSSQDPATWSFATASASFNNNSASSWSIEPQLSYTTSIFKGKFDGLIGGTLQYNGSTVQNIGAYGYTSDAQLKSLAAAGGFFGGNASSQYKYTGIFGRLTYNWTDKYIVNLNFRRDGSSRFGPGKQFGNFGSIGSAWIFTNEEFTKRNLPWLSFGKVRASYGVTGNDGIPDYQYLELFRPIPGSSGNYQGEQSIQSSGAYNNDYHWETTKKMEFALDLGVLADRILLSAAYFRTRGSDQLGNYTLPATGGNLSGIVINQAAKIQNVGAEFTLRAELIRSNAFNWTVNANLSIPTQSKLLSLPPGFNGYPLIYGIDLSGNPIDPIGKPFSGIIPVYEYRGVDAATGLYQFTANDGTITTVKDFANPLAKQIKTIPDFTGGISSQFGFKGFTLDIFAQFTKQMGRNYIFSQSFIAPGSFAAFGYGNLPVDLYDHRWQKSGDNSKYGKVSTLLYNTNSQAMLLSDAGWVDASFFRIQNVSLSYSISEKLRQKLGVRALTFRISGQNLFTFTKYKGTDPETQNPFVLAPLRVITTGFSLTL